MLRVAYLDFKLILSYLPLLENRRKNFKKFTGENFFLLHILSEYDFLYIYLFTVGFVKNIPQSCFKWKNTVLP